MLNTYQSKIGREGRGAPSSAFSLVELLVTLAVVCTLVVFVMLFTQRMLEQAKMAKCVGNVRQIVAAIHGFAQDNQGHIPLFGLSKNDPMNTFWPGTLAPYYFNEAATGTKLVGYGEWGCPASKEPSAYSYGVNYTGDLDPPIFTYPGELRERGPRLVNLSSNTMLIMDSHHFLVYNPKGWSLTDGESNAAFLPTKYNFAAFDRHNQTINAGFVDGSVRNIPLAEWKVNKGRMWGY